MVEIWLVFSYFGKVPDLPDRRMVSPTMTFTCMLHSLAHHDIIFTCHLVLCILKAFIRAVNWYVSVMNSQMNAALIDHASQLKINCIYV